MGQTKTDYCGITEKNGVSAHNEAYSSMARTENAVKFATRINDVLALLIFTISSLFLILWGIISHDFLSFAVTALVCGVSYLAVCSQILRLQTEKTKWGILLAIAFSLKIFAVCVPPVFSEDVFRYVYEGKVVWEMGWQFPFTTAPADAAGTVSSTLLDASFHKINHPEIATIYPPLSMFCFALVGGISSAARAVEIPWNAQTDLLLLKLTFLVIEVCGYLLIYLAKHSLGQNRWSALRWPLILALCPLSLFELNREGHADGIAIFGLCLGAFGFIQSRYLLGHFGWVLAILAKLNGAIGLLVSLRHSPKKSLWPLVILIAFAVPYFALTMAEGRGLNEYATRWRSFDGVFGLILMAAESLLSGDYGRIGVFTITRHQFARLITAFIFGVILVYRLKSRRDSTSVVEQTGELMTLAILFSPTFHPWYVTWLIPFVPFALRIQWGVAWLILIAPLCHFASYQHSITGRWEEPLVIRLLIHFPAWLLLMLGFWCPRAVKRFTSYRFSR
ncbi:MAG: hypothetical protein VYC39_04370 [Myxococcota bacterium]|nr:hypothetical protein [Myxococcota bacterium]